MNVIAINKVLSEKSQLLLKKHKGDFVRYLGKIYDCVNENKADIAKAGLMTAAYSAALIGGVLIGKTIGNSIKSDLSKRKEDKTFIDEELSPHDLIIRENIERRRNSLVLKPYENLTNKYNKMLDISASNPDDEENNQKLYAFEEIIKTLAKPQELKYHTSYFETLNSDYLADIDNICTDFLINRKNDGSDWKFLVLLNNNKISSEELNGWKQYPSLNCDEYKMVNFLPSEAKKGINDMKQSGKITGFEIDRQPEFSKYNFTLEFSQDSDLQTRFKTITEFYELINDKITVRSDYNRQKSRYTKYNIRDKIFKRCKVDKCLESVYNLARYLNYDALKYYEYGSIDLIRMFYSTEDTATLRNDIKVALRKADIKTEKMEDFVNAMNNDNLLGELFGGDHAKFRFITRVVLYDNYKANIKEELPIAVQKLKQALIKKTDGALRLSPYDFNGERVPSFLVSLDGIEGRFVITLDNRGKIYTLFQEA